MASPRDGFGGAVPSGSGLPYEIIRLKNGVPTPPLRLLPAMFSLRTLGKWTDFHAIHFGYKGIDKKDKTKTRMRPFECIQVKNRQTQMIEVNCDMCNLITAKTKLKTDAEAHYRNEFKKQGIMEEKAMKKALEAPLKPHNEWLRQYNRDSKWYVNCIKIDGALALLQIPNKMKILLDKKIEELRSKNLEPISNFDTGCYFVFQRIGDFNQASFTVEVYMEGDITAPRLKLAPVSDDQLTLALAKLPDLAIGVTRRISAEQITLLTTCSGDPAEVDTIMGMTQLPDGIEEEGTGETPPPPPPDALPQMAQPKPAAAAVPAPLPVPAAPAPAPVPQVDQAAVRAKLEAEMRLKMETEMRAKMEAELKAAMAKLTPAPVDPVRTETAPTHTTTVAAAAAPAAVLGVDPMDPSMSPEDFAKSFPPLPTR